MVTNVSYSAMLWKKEASHKFEKVELDDRRLFWWNGSSTKYHHLSTIWSPKVYILILTKFNRDHLTNFNKATRIIHDFVHEKRVTERLIPSLKTNWSLGRMEQSRPRLTWDSYMGLLRGTLTWDSYVGLFVGLLPFDSYVGLSHGTPTWDSYVKLVIIALPRHAWLI